MYLRPTFYNYELLIYPQNFKAPTLKSLFPCGDTMVVILDDREDVWQGAPNLVRVTPYVYFAGVPDVNATPLDMYVIIECTKRSGSA
jgi:hypothetical protein